MLSRPFLRSAAAVAATAAAVAVTAPACATGVASRVQTSNAMTAATARSVAVPSGFRPGSASFISLATGFVLGGVNCKPGHVCRAMLVATDDAGARWRVLGSPAGAITGDGTTTVDSVVFASQRIGWIYRPGIWVTTDGGDSWSRLRLGGSVMDMTVSSATVYAVVAAPRTGKQELFASPVGRNAWHRVSGVGTSPPEPSLAALGKSAWFGAGNTLWATADGSHWNAYAFACARTGYSLAGIAAASRSLVYFLCLNDNSSMGHERMEVMVSADGGKAERLAGGKSPVIGDNGLIAVPPGNPKVITFAASPGIPSWIGRSANGGKTWRQIGPLYGNGGWDSLQYLSKTVGWIVLGLPGFGRTSELLRTTDAGLSWHQVSF